MIGVFIIFVVILFGVFIYKVRKWEKTRKFLECPHCGYHWNVDIDVSYVHCPKCLTLGKEI